MEAVGWRGGVYTHQLCACPICPLVLYSGSNSYWGNQPSVGGENCDENSQERKDKGDKTMTGFSLETILGTFFYTIVIFGLGALSGKKIWYWVKAFFPWNKK